MRSLLLAVLFVLGLANNPPHQESGSPTNTNHPESDKRGTKEAPLVVETHANYTDQETAEHASEVNERESTNRWNIGLTSAIATCAALQFFALIGQAVIYCRQTRIQRHSATIIAAQARTMARQAKESREAFRVQNEIAERSIAAAEKSADAALKSAIFLEKVERPFLMLELRGEPAKDEVWIVNKGKIPAQIVWYEPSGMPKFLSDEETENMPSAAEYNYGFGLNNSEVFNVPWIAPDGEMRLFNFDWRAMEQDIAEIWRTQRRHTYVLSTVKYRGMLNDTKFESRWCYRWYGGQYGGLRLAGPYGYNSYT